ncbi:hypothetical protein G3O08_11625 [Cryomorpha ignava]|uniref:HEAT repeat domain-containing protein n=1 Tax=Cryomorpha ignava TaxID=101383 RepID=A0A7K3WSW6_9FLAO|nr:hypothetical protein [Cryomorpha ignava]NEN24151.1 hypothetical protein [Cryomorpha ignava]
MDTLKEIFKVIRKSENTTGKTAMYALKDLGLLTERHTQSRYNEDYSILFDEDNLIKLRLTDEFTSILVYYFFYRLNNRFPFAITTAWCLGKCYGYPIENGILGLLELYSEDDEVQQQLLFSLSSITDVRKNYEKNLFSIKNLLIAENKPKVTDYVRDRFPEWNV